MEEPSRNDLILDGRIVALAPLRRTPAGIGVIEFVLQHSSKQLEAGSLRTVECELRAVALGELAEVIAAAKPGASIRATGFLAARSMRSKSPQFHLNKIEFLEGIENGL